MAPLVSPEPAELGPLPSRHDLSTKYVDAKARRHGDGWLLPR
jgi:hypothetical protein